MYPLIGHICRERERRRKQVYDKDLQEVMVVWQDVRELIG